MASLNDEYQCQDPPALRDGRSLFDTNHTALPRILLTNPRSLNNKRDHLSHITMTDEDIHNCDIMFFTNTYLTEKSADCEVEGYNIVHRADRKKEETGKSRGGGLCALVKNGVNVVPQESVGDQSYELAKYLYYPAGHDKKRPPLIFILVYITGPAFEIAEKEIAEYYKKALEWSNGGPVFLLGYFNKCEFSQFQPRSGIYQYVTCCTNKHYILDRCYGNIQNAYKSKCKQPLCSQKNDSPNNVIILTREDINCDHGEVKDFLDSSRQADSLHSAIMRSGDVPE